jgi:hypothetical protein
MGIRKNVPLGSLGVTGYMKNVGRLQGLKPDEIMAFTPGLKPRPPKEKDFFSSLSGASIELLQKAAPTGSGPLQLHVLQTFSFL